MFGARGDKWVATDAANLGYWTSQSLDADAVVFEAAATLGYSRAQLVFDRTTPVGTREDVISVGMSWCQSAALAVTPLSNTDKAVVETAIANWWTNVKALTSNQLTFRETRWYDYQPITTRPGPVDRVTAVGVVGSVANGRLPDQLAMTQTYKTASRKHWGRSYWPFPGPATSLDLVYGRISTTVTNNMQGYLRTLLQTSGGSGLICPCVASIGYHGVLGIKELQTDNVADVIRSRRAKNPTVRASHTS